MQSSKVAKNILLNCFTIFAPRQGSWSSILMYHSVGDNTAPFTTSPKMFDKQLKYLVSHGYHISKLSKLVQNLKDGQLPMKSVMVTFDDGYEDNYTNVFPLLKKYNVPATIFLTTGKIGTISKDREGNPIPMLSNEQIIEMQESGLVEFLPHGEHHKKLHTLSKDDARSEVLDSLKHVEDLVGTTPRIFAYPSGKYTSETLEILAEERFEAAVTVQPGLVRKDSTLLELPRNHMDSQTSFAEFVARLSPAGEWYERLKGNKV